MEKVRSAPAHQRMGQQDHVCGRKWPCPSLQVPEAGVAHYPPLLQAVGEEIPSAKPHVMTWVLLKLPVTRSSSSHIAYCSGLTPSSTESQHQCWAGSVGQLRTGVQGEPQPLMQASTLSPCSQPIWLVECSTQGSQISKGNK